MAAVNRLIPSGRACFCGQMRMASRAVTAIYNRHLRAAGLQATQMNVLWAVAEAGSESVKKIAKVIAMDETTLLRNLRVLQRRDLVSLTVGEDRRQRVATLTAAGREQFAAALPHWHLAQEEIGLAMGDAGLDTMFTKLRKLVRAIR